MSVSNGKQSHQSDHSERIAYIERQVAPLVAKGEDAAGKPRSSLAERMAEAGAAGISVAVIEDGHIAWARGYGVLEAGKPEPVTPETLFQCASISKPVAAVMALRLVESGALTLDGDVNDALTSWKIPPVTYWWTEGRVDNPPHVTLRQLISHTGGLTVYGFPGYPVGAPLPSLITILNGEPPANTPPIRVDTVPGAQMRYSGGGYTVLTQLLEDVTGKPFPALAQELVLEPLGMRASGFDQPLPPERARRAAKAHHVKDHQAQAIPGGWHIYPELAPDGLWATPSDLARFALGLQAALVGEQGAILSQATMRAMMTPQAPEPDVDAVGLGVFLSGAGETARFGHTGGNEGFNCELVAYQQRGQGAVVMANGDGGWLVDKALLNTIAEAYNWPDYTPFSLTDAWGAADSEPFARFIGEYADDAGRRCVVTNDDGELWLAFGSTPPLPTTPETTTRYSVEGLNARVTFTLTDAGNATALTLHQNGRDIPMTRQ